MAKLAELWVEIGAKLDRFNKAMTDIERASQKMGRKLEAVGKKMTMYITLPLLAIGGASVKMAMDAVESENLFEESMKGMADSARKWSEELRDELGLNSYEVRKNVGTFNVMLKSMGLTENAAYDMSKSLTLLAYDMASFYNLRSEDAFEKIKSALVGMPRPLQELGILVKENTVEAWALKNGIVKEGQALTETQKVLGRFNVIMEATKTAQGDLARTIDSPANKLRVMQTRAKELGIEFGKRLLPTFSMLLNFLNVMIDISGKLNDTMGNSIVVIGGVVAALGPLTMMYGKMLRMIPLLNTAILGQRTAFIASAGGAAILLAALGALVYGFNKVKEAQDALAESERIHNEVSIGLNAKLAAAAKLAGMSSKEFLKLRDAYAAQYGTLEWGNIAMATAIRKGEEGKELQEALAEVSKKHKVAIDKQRQSLGGLGDEFAEYMKSLGDTKKAEQDLTSLREQMIDDFMRATQSELDYRKWAATQTYLVRVEALKKEKASEEDFVMAKKAYQAEIENIEKEETEAAKEQWEERGKLLTNALKKIQQFYQDYENVLAEYRDIAEQYTTGEFEYRRKKLDEWYQHEVQKLKDVYGETEMFYKALEELARAYNVQLRALAEEEKQQRIQAIYDVMSATSDLFSLLGMLSQTYFGNQITALNEEQQARRQAIENNIADEEERQAALESLDEEFERRKKAVQKRAFEAQKKISLVTAAINIAEAVTKAYTGAIPPFNFILAGLVSAAGAIQLAAIAAQKFPSYQEGGFVPKETLAHLHPGEYVLDAATVRAIRGGGKEAEPVPAVFNNYLTLNVQRLDDRTINESAEKIFRAIERQKARRGY